MEAGLSPEMLVEEHTPHLLAGRYLEAQEILGWGIRCEGPKLSERNLVPVTWAENKAVGQIVMPATWRREVSDGSPYQRYDNEAEAAAMHTFER